MCGVALWIEENQGCPIKGLIIELYWHILAWGPCCFSYGPPFHLKFIKMIAPSSNFTKNRSFDLKGVTEDVNTVGLFAMGKGFPDTG